MKLSHTSRATKFLDRPRSAASDPEIESSLSSSCYSITLVLHVMGEKAAGSASCHKHRADMTSRVQTSPSCQISRCCRSVSAPKNQKSINPSWSMLCGLRRHGNRSGLRAPAPRWTPPYLNQLVGNPTNARDPSNGFLILRPYINLNK